MDNHHIQNIDGIKHVTSPVIRTYTGTPQGPIATPPKPKKRFRKWVIALMVLLVLILGSGVGLAILGKKITNQSFVGQSKGWIAGAKDLIMGSLGQTPLEGEELGSANILLLGIGGSGHDGPYLSDTMILTQIKLNSGQAVLTSIPRDYQVKLDRIGYRKINAAFSEGYMKNKDWNEAGALARQVVADLSGLAVPYFAVIDFAGFEKAINQLGGIQINVPATFTDYQYPDGLGGYLPPQTFKQGNQTFNGSRALIYARSRHAAGNQGSDFARSTRQQQVLESVKDKVLELNLLADSGTITKLMKTFAENFHTNLTPGQILRLAKIAQTEHFEAVSSNLNPETGLVCPYITEETQAYVLVPCPGKTSQDIKNFFQNALTFGQVTKEKAVVWIAAKNPNSFSYRKVAKYFEQAGITVWPINYPDVEPESSIVYTINSKPATEQFLLDSLAGKKVTLAPPNIKIDSLRSDFIVILGTKLPETFQNVVQPSSAEKKIDTTARQPE